MFKRAVQKHNAPASSQSPAPTASQQTLLNSFRATAQPNGARPLSLGSGNLLKHNPAAERRASGPTHGTKRTASGLAKALCTPEEFDYPLNALGSPSPRKQKTATSRSIGNTVTGRAPVFFDENDFDSDLDLDVDDLAEKDTVHYPELPALIKDTRPADSGVGMESNMVSNIESASSQQIPWSSSPIEHLKRQPAPNPAPTKRRTLPWLKDQPPVTSTASSQPYSRAETEPGPPKLKKQKSGDSTPAPKAPAKSDYPWNTTASAVKEQQKALREGRKEMKAGKGTSEEIEAAKAKKRKDNIHRVFLSKEQQHVLSLVTEFKKSVFFTGSAGTGKSVLLREIISAMRRKFAREPDRIAVTASTGLAACNIGGVTLHSFAGIGIGKDSAEELVKKIRKNGTARQRWLRTKVLIVDEISMVDGELFDKLEQIARTIRNNGRPFGGIQLVITGDFFQLPPVSERGTRAKFAFDASTWTTTIEHTIGLHHVFRQKDPIFAGMLNEMREGRMSPETVAQFKKLERPLPKSEENIEATELFPTRAEVERANSVRMQQLHGQAQPFEARDGGSITDPNMRSKLLEKCMAPAVVTLKKGAQVMLIKNMDETLVNGSLGKVTGFMTEHMFNIYKENEEAFLTGDGGPTEAELNAAQKANALGVNTQVVYPVVRFSIADGTTRDLLCKRESWKYELPNGDVQASREQIPLILAWALSIHKAQGQTLERVRVDLGKAFEKGQAYVALSRATNMNGLQVLRFDASKVKAHERVRTFYSSLARAEEANEQTKKNTILAKLTSKTKKATDYEEGFVGS